MKHICKTITFSAMVWMITGINTCTSIARNRNVTSTHTDNQEEKKWTVSLPKKGIEAIQKGDIRQLEEIFDRYKDKDDKKSIANTETRLWQDADDLVDYVQESILYLAIYYRHMAKGKDKDKYLEIIQFLLKQGANPNVPRKLLMTIRPLCIDTPLTTATRAHDEDVVKLLLEHGTDVNNLDDTPDDYEEGPVSALHVAMYNGDIPILKILLAHKDIDVNQPARTGLLPLQASINGYKLRHDSNNLEAVRLLLRDKRIDVNKKSDYGNTAFNNAINRGLTDMVEILLEHPTIDLEQKNRYGRTPLAEAVHDGHVEIVELLLNYGANPEGIIPTKWGAFLSKLGSQKHKRIKELLEKARKNQDKTKAFKYIFDPIDVTKADGKCSICHTELVDTSEYNHAIALKCKHKFHLDCIDQWIKPSTATCPLCRAKIK
ncbi:ankyrin repeat domain-containing protein [Cardinium endosymbiont of Culicoides punctatus]|uniref:ankyrin repeat domain-containing protein n=1 Tax=Cardinium endosymbiont of Culicoides punctatus TaxID=2304601 RepID=UPI0010588F75|nr:ankyrin repeat domain-containing protein [Cardinium endosymbiont of Culicoides punctatus]TDG95800.1 hypothetical protein CCPUN_00860 [Cardinium endosymbiont of Culicoides punctatus]